MIYTDAATVVGLLQARLCAITMLPPERVSYDAREDDGGEWPTKADQYILIRAPGSGPNNQARWSGGGRNVCNIQRDIIVTLWTRLATDEKKSDEQWLLDQSFGHLVMEDRLWNALAGFQPEVPNDGSDTINLAGAWYTTTPIKPIGCDAPKKNQRRPGWGRSAVRFTVEFTLNLDRTYQ